MASLPMRQPKFCPQYCDDSVTSFSRALLSPFLAGTAPVIAVTLSPSEGGGGCPPPQGTVSQSRRMPMDIARAQQFLREHENAVLVTWRRDGRLQMSPVAAGVDGAGRAIISSQEITAKVRNLRRDPRAALC